MVGVTIGVCGCVEKRQNAEYAEFKADVPWNMLSFVSLFFVYCSEHEHAIAVAEEVVVLGDGVGVGVENMLAAC
jgi:hypothetical protein